MRSYDAIPPHKLRPAGPVTTAFSQSGITDLREAGHYLMNLPYGRTSSRLPLTNVLSERRGTCSSKHALFTSLAWEQGIDVQLLLAIFHMTDANTPGIAPILLAHGLPYIPEAHCYVKLNGIRIDITGPRKEGAAPREFTVEESITPTQIDEYKPAFHRAYLHRWNDGPDGPAGFTLDHLWNVREACIAHLSTLPKSSTHA